MSEDNAEHVPEQPPPCAVDAAEAAQAAKLVEAARLRRAALEDALAAGRRHALAALALLSRTQTPLSLSEHAASVAAVRIIMAQANQRLREPVIAPPEPPYTVTVEQVLARMQQIED